MSSKQIMTEDDHKILNSIGGIGGITAFLLLSAGILGFLIIRSNLNCLGIGTIMEVSIDEYIQEGGKYLGTAIIALLLSVLLIYGILELLKTTKLRERLFKHKLSMLVISSILNSVFIIASIESIDNHIIFNANSFCLDIEDINLFAPKVWFNLEIFILAYILVLIYIHHIQPDHNHKRIVQFFSTFWIILFLLLSISYGKNVYQKEFLLINDDIIFSDSLNAAVPQNNLLFIQDKASFLILYQYSERKIYYIAKPDIMQMSFSGKRMVIIER